MAILKYVIIIGLAVLLIYNYPKLFLVIIGILAVLFLIRLGADIFYWGKDKGNW
jgi:hypothetical protein